MTRARDNSCFVAFCNAVGGQDELIFDGHSCVLDDEGEVVARAVGFEETLLLVDVEATAVIGRRLRDVGAVRLARERETAPPVQVVRVGDAGVARTERTFNRRSCLRARARTDAARPRARPPRLRGEERLQRRGDQRLRRHRLAVTAALTAWALGSDRLHCVSMPSRYSSEGTRPMHGDSPRASAATSARSRSSRCSRRTWARCASSSPASPPTSPRRTCRRGSGARC